MAGNANSGGRNRKPKALHLVEGTFRKHRHDAQVDVEIPPGTPTAPAKLTGEAAAEWARMIERLRTTNTLTVVDDAALYQYVKLWAEVEGMSTDAARVRDMSQALMKEAKRLDGVELVTAVQEIVKLQFILSKHTTQLRQGHMAIRMYLVEFGMTPSARTRVKPIAEPKTKSEAELKRERFFGVRK